MASVFTFDPDPPRVSSPWSTPRASTPKHQQQQQPPHGKDLVAPSADLREGSEEPTTGREGMTLTRLEAEPQEGPTEYKLHLLLRPRRSFSSFSTTGHVSGSLRPKVAQPASTSLSASASRSASDSNLANTPPSSSSHQCRQHRLEQLTTQLLWRLQQSAPYHSSAANNVILPHLPEAGTKLAPSSKRNGRLLPGLDESKGALYEIGVADDGTFVGLADDELEESLNNLRAMAASLGCCVDVLRRVAVGQCEWFEQVQMPSGPLTRVRKGKLWVAEAFVRPDSKPRGAVNGIHPASSEITSGDVVSSSEGMDMHPPTEQLRVSLSGATMSGKSSLLGSLSTATLDNGRGKSRLSLLKHRHEIASGMTSSVTQELIGYRDIASPLGEPGSAHVINYASGNVSSWTDIHASTGPGRLVFLSDSAGHPRYRRTTVRGLVGWAPHWTLLCIPADASEDTSGKSGSTPSSQEVLSADVDLSQAHLELCLSLNLPLIVVITKFDLASKPGLRQTLSKLLSTIKASGRKPVILSDSDSSSAIPEEDLQLLSPKDFEAAKDIARTMKDDFLATVPIVFSSAVRGTGVMKLHALLRALPIPKPEQPPDIENDTNKPPNTLFHIEDIYSTLRPTKLPSSSSAFQGSIVSGHLRYGTIHIGDELLLGPYPADIVNENDSADESPPRRTTALPTSRSFPGALHKSATTAVRSDIQQQHEWRRVRVASIRNLRLPVHSLLAGQVGTVGVVPLDQPIATPAVIRIRKGMVLASVAAKAKRTFVAGFERQESVRGLGVGSAVVVYVASVRSSAKVVAVEAGNDATMDHDTVRKADEDDGFGFGFDDDDAADAVDPVPSQSTATLVSFQFIGSREYIELGSQVLVMPGGGPGLFGGNNGRGEKGLAGLGGFVGRVV